MNYEELRISCEAVADKIEETLELFDVQIVVSGYNVGPRVTQFLVDTKKKVVDGQVVVNDKPVKMSKIQGLADDLQLALEATSIRIEKVNGTGFVGIEVPNKDAKTVTLKSLIRRTGVNKLQVPIGQKVTGEIIVADIAQLPHLLIAGATGAGKSVALNSIISTLVMNNSPEYLKLVLIDPKRVELAAYRGIPHLYMPIINDPDKAVQALNAVTAEMDKRYEKLEQAGCRNIEAYNSTHKERIPYLVVCLDEMADIMMTSGDEVEAGVVRLAQLGRASGVHIIICTQRPTVNVVTGLIKANITNRIAFATASNMDSRVILDTTGADSLLGNGDGLFMNEQGLTRFQGAFITDDEINNIVEFRKRKHNKRKGKNNDKK